MGNLLGEPFRSYVNDQVKTRQKVHGKTANRSLNEITYLNSRNAWIKFASGVSLEKNRLKLLTDTGNPMVKNISPGYDLAIQNVLFSGLSSLKEWDMKKINDYKEKGGRISVGLLEDPSTGGGIKSTYRKFPPTPKSGIEGSNRAYGVGGTEFGYSPMPGITGANIKDLNRGSIKKATINVVAHNKNQFDIIDVLYLRLGYTVCLEWGNNIYLSEEKYNSTLNEYTEIHKVEDTLLNNYFWDMKKGKDPSLFSREINKKRKEYKGNYDGIIGMVSNFNWSFESNGTYNITIEITSIGDVIESLKVNLPPLIDTPPIGNAQNKLNAIKDKLNKEKAKFDVFYNTLYPGLDNELQRIYKLLTNDQKSANFYYAGGEGSEKYTLSIKGASDEYKVNPSAIADVEGAQKLIAENEISTNKNWVADLFSKNEGSVNSNILKYTTNWVSSGTGHSPYILIFKKDKTIKVESKFEGIEEQSAKKPDWLDNGGNDIGFYQKKFGENFEFYVVIGAQRDTYEYFRKSETRLSYLSIKNGSTINVAGNESKEGLTKYYKDLTNEQKNLAFPKLVSFDAFKQKFFEDTNLPKGGKDDDRFNDSSDDIEEKSPLETFTERLETGKYKNKINNWFYNIRKYYNSSFLVDTKDNSDEAKAAREKGAAKKSTLKKIYLKGTKYQLENSDEGFEIGYQLNPSQEEKEWDAKVNSPLSTNKTCDLIKLKITPIESSYFVRLGTLLEYIQNKVIMKIDGKYPFLKIDTKVESNICYVIDNMISTDVRKGIIKNSKFFTGVVSDQNEFSNIFEGLEDFLVEKDGYRWGRLMNLYLNFNRIEEIFSSVDKNNQITLFEVLKSICEDINEFLGGVNNIEPIIDRESSTIKFIDQTPIPGLDNIASQLGDNVYEERKVRKKEQEELIVFGYNGKNDKSNFIRSVGMNTEINKNYATAITIGATSQGSVPGMEATAFSRWNIGVKDRFKNKLTDPESPETSNTSSLDEENESVLNNYKVFMGDKYVTLGLNYANENDISINSDYISENKSTVKNYYTYAQAKTTQENYNEESNEGDIESSIGFLPINLKLEMDGIGGIRIYDFIKINTAFLPSNYPDTLEFICTGVNHKLENNEWITSLDTLATSIGKNKTK